MYQSQSRLTHEPAFASVHFAFFKPSQYHVELGAVTVETTDKQHHFVDSYEISVIQFVEIARFIDATWLTHGAALVHEIERWLHSSTSTESAPGSTFRPSS